MPGNPFERRHRLLLRLIRTSRAISRFWSSLFEGIAWPYIELAIRLWTAKLFFSFGILQLMHWQATLELASQENPIPFLAPAAATFSSTGIYLLCGVLLAMGFMTRYAALPLLALSCVTQLRYAPFDTQLFWMALSGWFVIHGAGAISLDHMLRRGLGDSAVPLIPAVIRVSTWLRKRGTPLYVAFLRVWLGAALLVAVYATTGQFDLGKIGRWLPLDVAMRIPLAAGLVGGTLLVMGAGTRYIATALLASLVAYSVVDPRATDSIYMLMFLAILSIYGGGLLSIDHALLNLRDRYFPAGRSSGFNPYQGLPRVVIVGAGFGGLRCAQALRDVPAAVTLIDRTNYHLFQPLLYQVATAALSPGDIATPARQIFRNAPSIRMLLGTVTAVDTQRQTVATEAMEIPYDYLVLATGATHSYFGKDAWAPFAPGLKRVEDALEIRRRILTAFERAEAASEEERKGLLTFLIVGGGPTGVELAGAIAELARYGLENDFRAFDPSKARVVLVQAAPRLLPAFPERLAQIAQR